MSSDTSADDKKKRKRSEIDSDDEYDDEEEDKRRTDEKEHDRQDEGRQLDTEQLGTQNEDEEALCQFCNEAVCIEEDLYREIVEIGKLHHSMEKTNKQIRYQIYRYYIHRIHGTTGKGNRIKIPDCVNNIIKDLYPSETYTGYIPGPNNDSTND